MSDMGQTCLWCLAPLQGKRRQAKYCSPRCRVYAQRKRNRQRERGALLPRSARTPAEIPLPAALETSPRPSTGDHLADVLLEALRTTPAGLSEDEIGKRYSRIPYGER